MTSRCALAVGVMLTLTTAASRAAVPAFPGAEGYGADTPGGRGGRIIAVTNLNDSGPGSLREALTSTGPRIVVFRVGGTIVLDSRILVSGADRSYLTVAGQTAPGDGIQTKGFDVMFSEGVHDVVVRHVRFRPGATAPEEWSKHAMAVYAFSEATKCHHFVFDHCSFYWGPDEGGCCWDYVEDVTWQWCTVEGLRHDTYAGRYEDSKAFLFGTDDGQGFKQKRICVHHTLMANCSSRNPLLCADGPFHVVNNVIYNWQYFGTGIQNRGTGTRVNLIGNLYRRGPSSSTSRYAIGIDGSLVQPDAFVYVLDNIGPFRPDSSYGEWAIVGSGYDTSVYWTAPAPGSLRRATPWPDAPIPVTVHSSADVESVVLAGAGAFPRDAVDARLVSDCVGGTGSIKLASAQLDSWWPVLDGGTAVPDADADGMPDAWETQYGLDPNDGADGADDDDGDGYTNVEECLNGTVPVSGGPPPADRDPVVSVLAPSGGAVLSGQVAYGGINAAAYDPDVGSNDGDGVEYTQFEFLRGGALLATATENSPPYDWGIDTSQFADGDYTLRATARSAIGAGGTSASAEITVVCTNRVSVDRDADDDLLPDWWEVLNGYDAQEPDSDGDGIPDGDEDADSDGVTNAEEFGLYAPTASEAGSPAAFSCYAGGSGAACALGVFAAFCAAVVLLRRSATSNARW